MKQCLTTLLLLSLMMPLGITAAARGAGTAGAPAAPSDRESRPASVDGGWPRGYTTSSGARLVLYEPQVAAWPDQKRIVLYAAVSYAPTNGESAALGTIRAEANTKVAPAERLVSLADLSITASNFPTLSHEKTSAVVGEISAAIPREERVIALDRVLAAVESSQVKPKNTARVKADPPAIFVSQQPAVLVNIDGKPIWSRIKDNDLRFAVNTNWDLFEYAPTKTYYLRVERAFMKAAAPTGPWSRADVLPDSFAKLPADDNWKDVKAAVVTHQAGAAASSRVFISTTPAELILLRGAPAYAAVAGTHLLWVNNTDSDVFRMGNSGPVYFLVSGRWFRAADFGGPWTFATPSLPGDFQRIPLEHPRSRVLASVPGTPQAAEAVLLAEIPQIARVKRSAIIAPEVIYQRSPKFELIDMTTVARAVNTDKDVLKVGDRYYLCVDGVWFEATTAQGAWTVTSAVPKAIYDIPISSPSYPVTHVKVSESDNDQVEFEVDPAYMGTMVAWGCPVWGTGWYYDPYYWDDMYYPVYYPFYPSYGYGARYNPWTGAYTRGAAVYGPYGGAGYAARYNPRTGTYARGAAAWGPAGIRGGAEAWNPRTGTTAQTRQGANVFGSWGATAVQRGDAWAKATHATNRRTGSTTRVAQGSGGNMFAGHDGNIYRNTGSGWQKYSDGKWSNVDRPAGTSGERAAAGRDGVDRGTTGTATRDQLDRDLAARREGAQRTRDFDSVRSGTSNRSGSGSYRPSGGGRGGGGMRMGGGGFRGGGRR